MPYPGVRGRRGLCDAHMVAKPRSAPIVERLRLRITGVDVRGPRTGRADSDGARRDRRGGDRPGWQSGRASIKRLTVGELEVTRLNATELEVAGEQRLPV